MKMVGNEMPLVSVSNAGKYAAFISGKPRREVNGSDI